ncbi:MAG: DNA-3-methyladenine glycosylase 2 family protein [Bacteroidota bacterium]
MIPKKALQLLEQDSIFKPIVAACLPQVQKRYDGINKLSDLYISLLRSIVSQQLSTKAADTIYVRFIDLFKDKYPHAKQVIKLKDEQLRAVGLSYQKISYIKAVAAYSLTNNLSPEHIGKSSNEEIIEELSSIKGVGKWTVEMILIFGLKRLDVFPYDDLIVRNRIITMYKLTSTGKQLKADCHDIAEQWKPYRSIASLFLWQSKSL